MMAYQFCLRPKAGHPILGATAASCSSRQGAKVSPWHAMAPKVAKAKPKAVRAVAPKAAGAAIAKGKGRAAAPAPAAAWSSDQLCADSLLC